MIRRKEIAKKLAHLGILSEDSSLKMLLMKGYVGGLGASAFNCLHIGLVGEIARSDR
jgi:hypothetical protein